MFFVIFSPFFDVFRYFFFVFVCLILIYARVLINSYNAHESIC